MTQSEYKEPEVFRLRPPKLRGFRYLEIEDAIRIADWVRAEKITIEPNGPVTLVLRHDRGELTFNVGSWVLVDWDGNFHVQSENELFEKYEPENKES